MATPRRKPPDECRQCGHERRLGYVISHRGLCRDCAIANQIEVGEQMRDRQGDYYDRWRERMLEIMPSKADRL